LPKIFIYYSLNVGERISVIYNGNVKYFLFSIKDNGEAMTVFPVNFLLIKEEVTIYNGNITIVLNGINNIRLRKYRVNVWNNNFVKRTNIYDNSAFFYAINFFLNHEVWVVKKYKFAKPLEAVLLIKFIELNIDDVAIS